MSAYYNGARGSFRNSSGALAMAPSPPSPAGSSCSSCESSPSLNTPWSDTPTMGTFPASAHHPPPGHVHRHHSGSRRRRQSISDGVRIIDPHLSSDGRPAPIIIHKSTRVPSPPRTSQSLQTAHVGERVGYHSPHALIVPSSSMHGRPRRDSQSGSLSANNLANHGYTRYYRSIQQSHGGNHGVVMRHGVTIFPRGLISREVLRDMDLPWKEDSEGRVVVQRELDGGGIQRLVDMTEGIRRRRDSPTGKAVSFRERTIVHEAPLDPDYTHRISKTITKTTTTVPGSFVPPPSHTTITTPFIPLPGSSRASEEKLARAEEKAARAEDRAARLENRAEMTGRAKDEQEAYKARVKAEEKHRKVEETLLKERVKMEEREGGARYHSINGRPPIRYRS